MATANVLKALVRAEKKGARLEDINAAHQAWCGSDNWAREGGRFAPNVVAWIDNETWRDAVPAAEDEFQEPDCNHLVV